MKTLAIVLILLAGSATDFRSADGMPAKKHPRGYVACKAAKPLEIDGMLNEASWGAAPWTDDFVDIEGDLRPPPRFRTARRCRTPALRPADR